MDARAEARFEKRLHPGGVQPLKLTVVGLHHAGLYVESLERSIAFYGDVFGLNVAERIEFDDERIAFLGIGSARLELIEADPRQRPTGVVDHVALEVTHLDALLVHLRQCGVTLIDPAPVLVPGLGARILFCLGPDGERLELLERVAGLL